MIFARIYSQREKGGETIALSSSVCACVCVRERERESVCSCQREGGAGEFGSRIIHEQCGGSS